MIGSWQKVIKRREMAQTKESSRLVSQDFVCQTTTGEIILLNSIHIGKINFSVLELPNPNVKTHIKADLEVLDILKVKYKRIFIWF